MFKRISLPTTYQNFRENEAEMTEGMVISGGLAVLCFNQKCFVIEIACKMSKNDMPLYIAIFDNDAFVKMKNKCHVSERVYPQLQYIEIWAKIDQYLQSWNQICINFMT